MTKTAPGPLPSFCREGKDISLSCSLFGMQHAYNMGYAFAVASWLGLSDEEAAAGIAEISPISGRGLCKRSASRGWVIDEAYNANPASMSAIRNTGAAARARRRNGLSSRGCANLAKAPRSGTAG